jgi:hypothetical protein
MDYVWPPVPMCQLKSPSQVNGGERRFDHMCSCREDKRRSGNPKIVFQKLAEILKFYRKGVNEIVLGARNR